MGKLNKYASESSLMVIDITYKGKRYKFNLYEETRINERRLNQELKTHASSYSFLTMLNNKIIYEFDLLEKDVERTSSKLYVFYKNQISDQTNKPYSDDMCKAKVLSSDTYKKKLHEMLLMKRNKSDLASAIRAFETRKDLMQTLSANVRKEI
jgi:hypothetical protein